MKGGRLGQQEENVRMKEIMKIGEQRLSTKKAVKEKKREQRGPEKGVNIFSVCVRVCLFILFVDL